MKHLLSIAIAVFAGASLSASTIYNQPFNNDSNAQSQDRSLSEYNWNAAYGPSGFVFDNTQRTDSEVEAAVSEGQVGDSSFGANSGGFAFSVEIEKNSAPSSLGAMALYSTWDQAEGANIFQTPLPSPNWLTDAVPFGSTTDGPMGAAVKNVSFTAGFNPNDPTLHWMVKVDGVWYASAGFAKLGGGFSDVYSLVLTDGLFYADVFTPGVSLTTDFSTSALTALDPNGTVEGVGALATYDSSVSNGGSRIRVNYFTVEVIPEPSVLALVGLGALAGLLIVRRRR